MSSTRRFRRECSKVVDAAPDAVVRNATIESRHHRRRQAALADDMDLRPGGDARFAGPGDTRHVSPFALHVPPMILQARTGMDRRIVRIRCRILQSDITPAEKGQGLARAAPRPQVRQEPVRFSSPLQISDRRLPRGVRRSLALQPRIQAAVRRAVNARRRAAAAREKLTEGYAYRNQNDIARGGVVRCLGIRRRTSPAVF